MVPGVASRPLVGPASARTAATASTPARQSATTGAVIIESFTRWKKGFALRWA